MSVRGILRDLRRGPMTNAQLVEAITEPTAHAATVARDCAKLIHTGRVIRVDGGQGRGTKATYALATRKQADG